MKGFPMIDRQQLASAIRRWWSRLNTPPERKLSQNRAGRLTWMVFGSITLIGGYFLLLELTPVIDIVLPENESVALSIFMMIYVLYFLTLLLAAMRVTFVFCEFVGWME